MSVAFRRESDEEHREPRFELPLPSGPNLVTRAGAVLIDTRLAELEAELAAADAEARPDVERSLRYWRTRHATARPTTAPADGTAGFATRVTFRLNGQERTIAIVGDDEADPAAGRIAFSAPLARALSGAEPGERVAFNGREDAIELIAVAPIEG